MVVGDYAGCRRPRLGMSFGDGSDWTRRGRPRPSDEALENLLAVADQWRGRFRAWKIGPWLVLLVILALYLLSGIYTIAPDEQGVVLRFGRAVRQTGPGPHYRIPWPFEHVLKVQTTQIRKEEIGFRTVSPGPPARYRRIDNEALMLTGDNNIVKLDFIVQYRVKPEPDGARDFLFNVVDPRQAVRDAAEAAMREVIGASKIDDALTEGKQRIQDDTERLLQQTLDEYDSGVDVVTVQLQDVGPPDQVSDAFKDVISAEQDKERMINEARGYSNDIVPKARGRAAQLINEAEAYREAKVRHAEGTAQRFISIYEEYTGAAEVTKKRLYLETMEEILPRVDKIILDENTGRSIVPYLPLDRLTGPRGRRDEQGSGSEAGAR
jgi:membrane protease subunit HflK